MSENLELIKRKDNGTSLISNWTAIHSAIVMDKIQGLTIDMLCEKYNYTQSHISNILRTKQSKQIQARVNTQVLAGRFDNLSDEIKAMKVQAFENMKVFLQNENLAVASPFAFFDRSIKAFEVLDGMSHPASSISGMGTVTNIQNNIFTNPESISHLTAGLDAALEVSQKYQELPEGNVDGSAREFTRVKRIGKDSEGAGSGESEVIKVEG